jgi:hypothetical protein
MAKRRIERAVNVESHWDWLLQHSERDQRERRAYVEACDVDKEGRYSEADDALLAAGVRAEVVQNRRVHIDWRLSRGMSAIEQSISRASWRTET